VLEVLYYHAKFGGARISPAAGVAKNVASIARRSQVTLRVGPKILDSLVDYLISLVGR